MTAPLNPDRTPRYWLAGLAGALVLALLALAVYGQFRGDFTRKATLTMLSSRAGLVMDPGSKGQLAKCSSLICLCPDAS